MSNLLNVKLSKPISGNYTYLLYGKELPSSGFYLKLKVK